MIHIDGELLNKMFIQGNNLLYENSHVVDSLNVFPVPDGDTGTNMSLTLNSAITEIKNIEKLSIENIAMAASKGSLMGARGNSGVILSQILRGFEKGCRGKEVLTKVDFANALKEASDTAYKAVIKPIEGTLLTIIREASKKALELSNQNDDFSDFIYRIILHSEAVLYKTPQMLDVLKQAGVVDAGGKGLIFIFKGFWQILSGKDSSEGDKEVFHGTIRKDIDSENIEFNYCTEFIIKGKNLKRKELEAKIKDYGDSILIASDEDLIKVHIHTNNPGKIIEYGLGIGELIDIKIDNMSQQYKNNPIREKNIEKHIKRYGFISVAMGEGMKNILKDLDIEKVIEGGQTINPSTEDILMAIDETNAENIFVLPNNSNIILAANQAKELSDKNIIVIPSKSIPQGITSMLEFDMTAELDKNIEKMTEALSEVKTVKITYAARASKFKCLNINKGDILGICDDDIIKVGDEVVSVVLGALDEIIIDDYEILTIYYGEEISEEEANELYGLLEEKYKNLDIEIYYGGQPLYYYIFSIE